MPAHLLALATAIALVCSPALSTAAPARPSLPAGDLGPPNYEGFCQSLGYSRDTFTAEAVKQWGCLHSDSTVTLLDVQKACEFTFKQRPIVARELKPGVLYSWQCLKGTGAPGSGPGAGTPGAGAGPTQANAWLLVAIVPTGRTARIAALLRSGGYTTRFTAPGAGRLVVSWYFLPKGARISRAAPKPTLVATGRASFMRAGVGTIRITLTSKGRQLLRGAKRLRLTARASFSPTVGAAAVSLRTFTLKR